jgi:hypothetical protein
MFNFPREVGIHVASEEKQRKKNSQSEIMEGNHILPTKLLTAQSSNEDLIDTSDLMLVKFVVACLELVGPGDLGS